MRATGIVTYIHDNGDVVIPKIVRDAFDFPVGMPMEIFLNNKDEIVLKKYNFRKDDVQIKEKLSEAVRESVIEEGLATIGTQALTELYEALSITVNVMGKGTVEWCKVYDALYMIGTALQHRKENEK